MPVFFTFLAFLIPGYPDFFIIMTEFNKISLLQVLGAFKPLREVLRLMKEDHMGK